MTWEISITCARMYFESNIPYEAVLVSPVPIMYTFVSSVSIGYWWAQYPYKLVSSILIYWWAQYQLDTGEPNILIYWWAQYPYILVSPESLYTGDWWVLYKLDTVSPVSLYTGEPSIIAYWCTQNYYIIVCLVLYIYIYIYSIYWWA